MNLRRVRQSCSGRRTDETGSAAIEAAVGLPAFVLFVGMIILAGRVEIASQSIDSAAFDAARVASIERSRPQAVSAGKAAALSHLSNQHLNCLRTSVEIDAGALAAEPGVAGHITVTVTCTVALADLSLPGVPGSRTLIATATSPIDPFRAQADRPPQSGGQRP